MPYYTLQMVLRMQDLFGHIGHFQLNATVDDYNQQFEAGAIPLQALIIMLLLLHSFHR